MILLWLVHHAWLHSLVWLCCSLLYCVFNGLKWKVKYAIITYWAIPLYIYFFCMICTAEEQWNQSTLPTMSSYIAVCLVILFNLKKVHTAKSEYLLGWINAMTWSTVEILQYIYQLGDFQQDGKKIRVLWVSLANKLGWWHVWAPRVTDYTTHMV
jgi:hypothetical protein